MPTNPRSRPGARQLIGACALLLAAATADAAPSADAAQVLNELCAPALQGQPEVLDAAALASLQARVETFREVATAEAITLVCRLWAAQRLAQGADHPDTLALQANLGIGLFSLRRADQALLLLQDTYQRALPAGEAARVAAQRSAGALSAIYGQRQQMQDVVLWSQRAVELLPPGAEATEDGLRLLINHAGVLSMLRRQDEAAALFQRLLAPLEQQLQQEGPHRFVVETITILHQWAVAERRRGNLQKALDLNTRNLALLRRHRPDLKLQLGLALHNQGLLLRGLARYDEAEATLREGLAEGGDATTPDLWQSRSAMRETLSSLLTERGKLDEARALAGEAVSLLRQGPEAGSGALLRPLRRLANVQAAQGDLGAAMASLREAVGIMNARADAGDIETRVLVWLAWARAMLWLGDTDEAAQALDRAQAQAAGRPVPPIERAQRLQLRAQWHAAAGRPAAALQALQDADTAWAEVHGPAHPERVALAVARCRLGSDCETLAARAQATTLLPGQEAELEGALAAWAQSRQDSAAAERHARHALEAALAAGDAQRLWPAWAGLAEPLAATGRLAEAVFAGKQAVNVIQRQRRDLLRHGLEQGDARYLADKATVYRKLADRLLQLGRMAEALEVLALAKRLEQDDWRQRSPQAQAATLSLTPAEQALAGRIDELTRPDTAEAAEWQRLRRLQQQGRLTAAERDRLQALQAAQAAQRPGLRQQLESLLARTAQDLPAAAPAAAGAAVSADLLAVPGELRTWAWVQGSTLSLIHAQALRGGGQKRWSERIELPDASALPLAIGAVHSAVQSRRSPSAETLAQLRRWLVAPLARARLASGEPRLRLWLDGALRYLPLAALWPAPDRAPVVVLDGSALGGAAATAGAMPPRVGELRLQGFGVTLAHAGMPALPAVADELCSIVDGPVLGLQQATAACAGQGPWQGRGPVKGQAALDSLFTEDALLQASRSAPLLHVGTHFVLRPGHMDQSWLMLGDGQRLSLGRLQGVDLGRPRLVTLSACETALPGQGADGRELDGLAGTWMAGGAQQVLATLWRVDDRQTARFMQRFYRHLQAGGGDTARALWLAQQDSRRAEAVNAPPWWAAFTLTVR